MMRTQSSLQIVFDTATRSFQNNQIFDPQHAAKFPGALTWAVFGDHAKKRGWGITTSDVYLKKSVHTSVTLCISEMVTPFTKRVLATGAIPFIILCGESPNVAWDFYHNVGRYSCPYRHAFLFLGAGARVKPPTRFHPFYWSNANRNQVPVLEWNKRKLLTMVASNKQRFSVPEQKALKSTHRLAKMLLWEYLHFTDPLFRFEDLYQRRVDAICYFAHVPGFSLFGMGWDQQRGLDHIQWQIIHRLRPIPIEDKLDTLRYFRFALCFENCVFPGYVTEKIFDCFLAGCIPVYLGAPDIANFVPVDTFIDVRKYSNWPDIYKYLCVMTENEFNHYQEAIRNFLASESYNKYHQSFFVDQLIAIIESEIRHA